MDKISKIAKKYKLKILEDSAQSLGSTYKKKHTGTFGDIGCYSLYPAKVMTSGEGGFLVTNDKKLYEKLQMIRNHGMVHGYDTKIFGLNLRMPEINAAIAKEQIKKLPRFLAARKKNAQLLTKLLSDLEIKLPTQRKNENVNWYLYTIAIEHRDALIKKLNSKGFGAVAYYPTPVHKTPFYKMKIKLPITDWSSKHVVSVPIQPNVTSANIKSMARIIRETVS